MKLKILQIKISQVGTLSSNSVRSGGEEFANDGSLEACLSAPERSAETGTSSSYNYCVICVIHYCVVAMHLI